MNNFLKNIKNSMFGPAYYRELLTQPLSCSLKYFFALALILACIGTVVKSFVAVPPASAFFKALKPTVLKYYPNDLEIKIQKGIVSTNVAEPCFIRFPGEYGGDWSLNKGRSSNVENLLVVDTKTPFSLDQFEKYNTVALLMRDSLAYRDDQKVSMLPLKGIGNWKLDHAMLAGFMDRITPFFVLVPPVVVAGIFTGFFLAVSAKLFYLFFLALLVWVVAKIKKLSIGYANAYKISIHLITLGLLLEWTLYLAALPQFQVRFLFTILAVALAFVNLRRAPDSLPVS